MVISPEFLDQARAAGGRLDAAEKDALVARGDYHSAIRRLHLAGGSLREIAEALSLSHQRVQQIVQEAGGTWWSRAWRSRRLPSEAVCTWCGRPPADVNKLIAGPNVFICDACVDAAERSANGQAAGPFRPGRTRVTARCAFCSRRALVLGLRVPAAGSPGSRALVASDAGHVCLACLKVCREILDGGGKPR
jgi:hypothetical protein